jgi:hypothetical protein
VSYAYSKGKREVFVGDAFMEKVRSRAGKGPEPHPFGLSKDYALNPDRFSGQAPPELSAEDRKNGMVWANVGSRSYQTTDHGSGSTNHQESIWQKIERGGSAAAKEESKPSSATSPETPFTPSAGTLQARDRVQSFLDGSGSGSGGGSGGGSGLNLSATGGSLYQNLFNAGEQSNRDYEKRFLPYLEARGSLAASEIGDTTGNALARWQGTPPDLMGSEDIKKLFKYYSGKIKDA